MKPIYNTLFIGKVLIELDDYPSTNSYAKELISKSKPIEGTAIIAHNQYQGRGQYGKKWMSEEKKNLTFSLILLPAFLNVTQQFYLNKIICNSIVDWLAEYKIEGRIKWPNDIYVGDRKLGGVLIENTISKGTISSCIIGIGINLNQEVFDESLPNPTSLKLLLDETINIERAFSTLLRSVEKWYFLLKRSSDSFINDAYHSYLYRLGSLIRFDFKGEKKTGLIQGVNEIGELNLLVGDSVHSFSNHEIKIDVLS